MLSELNKNVRYTGVLAQGQLFLSGKAGVLEYLIEYFAGSLGFLFLVCFFNRTPDVFRQKKVCLTA
jgi:hypothetical protein